MLDDEFPEEVRRLKPRKVHISKDIERVLGTAPKGQAGDARHPAEAPRPDPESQNAIRCAACGGMEYISRPYCRCGHYLQGQLEDEFLAWLRSLREENEILAKDAERRIKPFRLPCLLAVPFMIVPLLYAQFWAETRSVAPLVWMLPGFAIAGLYVLIDACIMIHKRESDEVLAAADFETFLLQRPPTGT